MRTMQFASLLCMNVIRQIIICNSRFTRSPNRILYKSPPAKRAFVFRLLLSLNNQICQT